VSVFLKKVEKSGISTDGLLTLSIAHFFLIVATNESTKVLSARVSECQKKLKMVG